MFKKLIVIILTLLLMTINFDNTINAFSQNTNNDLLSTEVKYADFDKKNAFSGGDGSEENPYLIKTAEELNNIRYNLEANYKLVNDIDLSIYENWIPIGTANKPFIGGFDGNNHTIGGLTISKTFSDINAEIAGLFGICYYLNKDHGAMIKNIIMKDVCINVGGTIRGIYVGAIAADNGKGNILNCVVEGFIKIRDSYNVYVGGITSRADNIEDCINNISIEIEAMKMDDRGYHGDTVLCGGIVGFQSKIKNCINYADIKVNAGNFVLCGGICGKTAINVEHCANYGNISGDTQYYELGTTDHNRCEVGGIVGSDVINCINDCVNFGNVKGNDVRQSCNVAGLVAGSVNDTIFNSYNIGKLISSKSNIARIVLNAHEIRDCYSLDTTLVNGVIATEQIGSDQPNGASLSFDEIKKIVETKLGFEVPNERNSDFMISRVKAYTTSEFMNKRLDAIMNDDTLSGDEKLQKLNDFFGLYEMTDYHEGIDFIRDTLDERWDLSALLNNQMYCAWNFKDALQHNFGMRSALYTSGLIFNMEFLDWIDPGTYLTMETPGIKKYKAMLLSYLKKNVEDKKFYECLKESNEVLDQLSYLFTEIEKATIQSELKDCKTTEDIYGIFVKFLGNGEEGKDFKFDIKDTEFSKALGYVDKVIDVFGKGAEDYNLYLEVNTNLELYKQNRDFFEEIANSSFFPFEMRVAALQIQDMFEKKEETLFKKISADFVEFIDKGTSNMLDLEEMRLGTTSMGDINEAIAVIKFSVWVTNGLIDVASFVQEEASVEAYAYLSEYYANKLRSIKSDFLLNSNSKNAWAFYDCYNKLREFRISGEEAYLKMNNIKGFFRIFTDYGFQEKYKVAEDTINRLKYDYAFNLEHVDYPVYDHKYKQKIIVACPVDVEIYDIGGNKVYTIKDGEDSDVINEFGRFISAYRSYTGDYIKIAYLNDENKYTFKLIGRDTGLVSATITKSVDNGDSKTYGFDFQKTEKRGTIQFTTDLSDKKYIVDRNGDGMEDFKGNMIEKSSQEESIHVAGITTEQSNYEMKVGDVIAVSVKVDPINATNPSVSWRSDSPEIVSVENGKVTAVSEGEAIITATTIDGGYQAKVKIKVVPSETVSSITLDNSSAKLSIGESKQLKAKITPSDATTELTWTSSDVKVVKVDENGMITAVGAGEATITVKTSNGLTSTCEVHVDKPFLFTDVPKDKWYYNTIKEAYNLGLVSGTTETTFSPNAPMNRGMVATVLHRMAGSPAVSYSEIFPDVAKGKYYSNAVTWAAKEKIISGYKDGRFGPGDNITRQDMAVILYNYASKNGADMGKVKDLETFKDGKTVSSYAQKAMKWAVGNGIISGTSDGKLNPKASAMRAECTKMLLQTYKITK